MATIVTRIENESFDTYASRLFRNYKEYGISCDEIALLLNNESHDTNKTESAWRKYYTAFNRGRDFERVAVQDELDDQYLIELRSEREAIQKEKVRLQDQRREYNKLLAYDARAEHLYDELKAAAKNMPPIFLPKYKTEANECESIVFVSDVHFGMKANNVFGIYNVDICKERFAKYAAKVRHYLEIHRPRKLHIVVLGDLIHAAIHVSTRVASSENVVDQLMHVSELLAQFIADVQGNVEQTDCHIIGGNHGRALQGAPKQDCPTADNLEKIIPFWLKERLANCENVQVSDPEIDGFIHLDIYGWGFICTHGDLEKFSSYGLTMQALFSKKYGWNIHYAVCGDKHHAESKDMVDVESIICPAMCGVDDYADSHRLYSTPAQLMMIVTPDGGAECRIPIRFD